MSGVRRGVWVVPLAVVAVGVLLVVVFPTRTFLAQQASVRDSSERLRVLQEENALLEAGVAALHERAEIERRARELGLVYPGEEALWLLPEPAAPAPPPQGGTPPPVEVSSTWHKARDWLADRF